MKSGGSLAHQQPPSMVPSLPSLPWQAAGEPVRFVLVAPLPAEFLLSPLRVSPFSPSLGAVLSGPRDVSGPVRQMDLSELTEVLREREEGARRGIPAIYPLSYPYLIESLDYQIRCDECVLSPPNIIRPGRARQAYPCLRCVRKWFEIWRLFCSSEAPKSGSIPLLAGVR